MLLQAIPAARCEASLAFALFGTGNLAIIRLPKRHLGVLILAVAPPSLCRRLTSIIQEHPILQHQGHPYRSVAAPATMALLLSINQKGQELRCGTLRCMNGGNNSTKVGNAGLKNVLMLDAAWLYSIKHDFGALVGTFPLCTYAHCAVGVSCEAITTSILQTPPHCTDSRTDHHRGVKGLSSWPFLRSSTAASHPISISLFDSYLAFASE